MVRTLAAVAALAVGLTAAHAQTRSTGKMPGTLDVFDDAKLFTADGVAKAKEKLRATEFHLGLTVTVDTVSEVPAEKKTAAEAASHDKDKWRAFLLAWARDNAKHDRAKGVYVLVTTAPVGGVAVIADRQTTDRGFTQANDDRVREILTAAFKEAKAETNPTKQQEIRSAALLKAVEYIASDLKDTRVAGTGAAAPAPAPHREQAAGGGIGGYICMGLFALAGVWLVIGLIRMFTGGGGGGGGSGMGGGGGGGFFTSLLGGMFGAAAGMWMYNSMFGGHGGMFGGSDAYAGDAGAGAGGDGGNTGAGDWDGGGGAAGGFDGGGDVGGGDFGGGGGGDFGGDF